MYDQVARQARTNCGALLAISINLVACILFIYFVFLDNNLPLSAFFNPPDTVPSFYDLIWIVGVNDFILKFLAVLSKIVVTLMPAKIIPYQKRVSKIISFTWADTITHCFETTSDGIHLNLIF